MRDRTSGGERLEPAHPWKGWATLLLLAERPLKFLQDRHFLIMNRQALLQALLSPEALFLEGSGCGEWR